MIARIEEMGRGNIMFWLRIPLAAQRSRGTRQAEDSLLHQTCGIILVILYDMPPSPAVCQWVYRIHPVNPSSCAAHCSCTSTQSIGVASNSSLTFVTPN